MTAQRRACLRAALLGIALLVAPAALLAPPAAAVAPGFTDPSFEKVWMHCDKPVQEGLAARSWMWGTAPLFSNYEPYAEGPGGQRLVQYFDKSRMEINNPGGDRNSEWFVTNGLLVVEMITGRVQVANNRFTQVVPASIPLAGDTATSANAPTYAGLAGVASLNGDNRAANRTGQQINEGLGRTGNVSRLDNLAQFARYAVYEPTLGHNIPDVFWQFMNKRGITYHQGEGYRQNDLVVDWMFALGYPVTEPYWINIRVGSEDRWVLVQAFQRRILTYSPFNPEGWKVEMGNAGRAYYDWRYSQQVTPPTTPAPIPAANPTPVPAPRQASLTIDPAEGWIDTPITVQGRDFPPTVPVMLWLENTRANYFRGMGNVTTDAAGWFTRHINLPTDAASLGEITIAASAQNGAVRATQRFRLSYSPLLTVPPEAVNNGTLKVNGDGFPPRTGVRLGLAFIDGTTEWVGTANAGDQGSFEANLPVGNRAIGSQFTVIALTDGGLKVVSKNRVTVIAQPELKASPASGPASVYVTLEGKNWSANRSITVGVRPANSQNSAWLPNAVASDGAGNFSVPVWIGPEYGAYTEVRIMASEAHSGLLLEVPYYINNQPVPTATPTGPNLAVSPLAANAGMTMTVTGAGWPSGARVSLGLGRAGVAVEEPVGTATASSQGTFNHTFLLSSKWQGTGRVMLVASVASGPASTTGFWAISTDGRISAMGLSMQVAGYTYRNGAMPVKLSGSGWQPGSLLNINLVSADGSVYTRVATSTVGSGGAFTASFDPPDALRGRTDLGLLATTPDAAQFSVRYLPVTTFMKVDGATYRIQGANWPASSPVDLVLHIEDGDLGPVATTTTQADGTFSVTIQLPKMPPGNKNYVEVHTRDLIYSALFDF